MSEVFDGESCPASSLRREGRPVKPTKGISRAHQGTIEAGVVAAVAAHRRGIHTDARVPARVCHPRHRMLLARVR